MGDVPGGRGKAGRGLEENFRHAAERHPEGIHRAEGIHLPTGAFDASGGQRPVWYRFTPKFNTISISGYHIREAGSTALQELAFTLYDGVEYVEWAQRRGLDVDDFGPRLSFFLQRPQRLFRRDCQVPGGPQDLDPVMKDRFRARNERSRLLRFHTQRRASLLPRSSP